MQDIIARGGIDAADRLVEQIELRSAAHGKHELDLFLHALGHLADGLVEIQTELREHPFGGCAVKIGKEVAIEIKQLARLHPGAERDAVRQIGHDGVGLR